MEVLFVSFSNNIWAEGLNALVDASAVLPFRHFKRLWILDVEINCVLSSSLEL